MTLRRITLRDFVIVAALELELSQGFTALTGETGAGKSILIDALQLVLGARADSGLVREGAPRCEVGAEFDSSTALNAWLDEAGFEASDTLLLRRVVDMQGKSRAWINGSPATATQLRALAEQLVDIHGQHAWQSLTRADAVRQLLDAYANCSSAALAPLWQRWRAAQQSLVEAQGAQAQLAQERERVLWQLAEFDKLAPGASEWDELNTTHTRLAHANSLVEAAQTALALLDGDETQASSSALRQLSEASHQLQNQEHLEPEFGALVALLATAQAQLADGVHTLHAYLNKTEPDPQRLAELDQRLGQWVSLARRFRIAPEQLHGLGEHWRAELARFDAASDLLALERALAEAKSAYDQAAQQLSRQRQQAAPRLARAVTEAMQGLGLKGGRFEVALRALESPSAAGLEQVEFLVSGHAGATPRAVAAVASGGELSRIALAIAVCTSELGSAGCLIFDEVDAGVGGAVAQTVGRLMKRLGQHRQVLAVTHLPQVAACADHHVRVLKEQQAGRVSSSVQILNAEQRVNEIARMLGGERLSDAAHAHAKEMLGTAA